VSEVQTRCLILGSGIAGLSVAVAAAERGIETMVISCAPSMSDTNTLHAQGGISYEGANANPEEFIEDILEAGCRVNYLPAVRQVAELGPKFIRSMLLEKVGVPFDREGESYILTREAAHRQSRILHRGDESGRAIEESMLAHCEGLPNLTLTPRLTAVNLLMTSFHGTDSSLRHEPARCFGAFVFDQKNCTVYPIFAEHTVIATGGIGQLYLHNTNSPFARGDGIALAYRAGCRLENLEYIQFHPTTFFHPESRRFHAEPIACPRCGRSLERVSIPEHAGVILDRCGQCGVWVDGHEVDRVFSQAKAASRAPLRRRRSIAERYMRRSAGDDLLGAALPMLVWMLAPRGGCRHRHHCHCW